MVQYSCVGGVKLSSGCDVRVELSSVKLSRVVMEESSCDGTI